MNDLELLTKFTEHATLDDPSPFTVEKGTRRGQTRMVLRARDGGPAVTFLFGGDGMCEQMRAGE